MVAKGRLKNMKQKIKKLIQNETLSKILIASIILIIFSIIFHLCMKYFLIQTLIFLWIAACLKLVDWIYKFTSIIYEVFKKLPGDEEDEENK